METFDNTLIKSYGGGGNSLTFFNHVFSLNNDAKNSLLNICQYVLLALIPVTILNKSISRFVPDANDSKNTIEIIIEIVLQILAMFIGMFFIDRIITYVPTWSEIPYAHINLLGIIIPLLIIILSLKTKMGDKITILVDRVVELWNGESPNKKETDKEIEAEQQNAAVSYVHQQQPLQTELEYQQQQPQQPMPIKMMAANAALGGGFGTAIRN